MDEFAGYYPYKSLPDGHIRLLRICSSNKLTDFSNEDIHVELETHDTSSIKYDALSYTWGPPTLEEELYDAGQILTSVPRCYPIYCDKKIILVTKYLRQALRRLRMYEIPKFAKQFATQWSTKKLRKSRLIWIDAICINQDDLQERSIQVAHMSQIYSNASLVFAYVGELEQNTLETLEGMAFATQLGHMYDAIMAKTPQMKPGPMDLLPESEFWKDNVLGLGRPSTDRWWGWAILLNRRWFRRLWVLQEVMLAGTGRALLLCGNHSMELHAVLLSVMLVWNADSWTLSLSVEFHNTANKSELYKMHYLEVLDWLGKTHSGMHRVALTYWLSGNTKKPSFHYLTQTVVPVLGCGDPRDKVYATAAIISDGTSSENESALPIDYTLPVWEVYCYATKKSIANTRNLHLLTSVEAHDKHTDRFNLPSWCPNFYLSNKQPASKLMWSSFDGEIVKWEASGNSHHEIDNNLTTLAHLRVTGYQCDRISQSAGVVGVTVDCLTLSASLKFLENCMASASGKERESMLQAYLRAICRFDGVQPLSGSGLNPSHEIRSLAHQLEGFLLGKIWSPDTASEDFAVILQIVEQIHQIATLVQGTLLRQHLPNTDFLCQEVTVRKQAGKFGQGFSQRLPINSSLLGLSMSNKASFDANERHMLHTGLTAEEYVALIDGIGGIISCCDDRRFFITNGGRIGMGHETLKDGDQLWLLAGSRVPFLIRLQTNGNYQPVGETYVDTLMYGELWPKSNKNLTEIVLE